MPRVKGQKPKRNIREDARGVGRPSIFRVEYCQMLIKHMKDGYSFASFAAIVGCHWDTLYEWANPESDQYQKEFSEAKKHGDAELLLHDEKLGLTGMTGRLLRVSREVKTTKQDAAGKPIEEVARDFEPATFGQASWIFTMKNRHPEFYKDRQDHTFADPDGKPLPPAQVFLNIPSNGRERIDEPSEEPEDV